MLDWNKFHIFLVECYNYEWTFIKDVIDVLNTFSSVTKTQWRHVAVGDNVNSVERQCTIG